MLTSEAWRLELRYQNSRSLGLRGRNQGLVIEITLIEPG